MLGRDRRSSRLIFNSFDFESFFDELPTVGPERIPVLRPESDLGPPEELVRFDNRRSCSDPSKAAIHFYVGDDKLVPVARSPERCVAGFEGYASVITPDFSIYRAMARHQKIGHTHLSRRIGAIFQYHGVRVIPNIRWSSYEDFEFCFEGVPRRSIVAVSTHGCCRSREDREVLRIGLEQMVERLDPRALLVHGARPWSVFRRVDDLVPIHWYESDISRAHPRPTAGSPHPELPFGQAEAGPEVGMPGMSFM